MNWRSNTQTKKSSFSPIQTGLLQRKCTSCEQHTIAGGECTGCAKKKVGLQRKLTIGASNDPLELEADRIADRVMATPANSTISAVSPRIQRFAGQTNGQADMEAPASVDRVLASPGRPLDPSLQQDMGQRFGHDFSRVRVHTDAAAARSARDLDASAFTVGQDVVFGAGQYKPQTGFGKRLLAHELTHVVQNKIAPIAPWGSGSNSTTLSELEADRVSQRVQIGLNAGRVIQSGSHIALTPTSKAIEPLISYGIIDWEVTSDDETKVLNLLKADTDLSKTINDLDKGGMLDELIDRVDEDKNRRELLKLLGAKLDSVARSLVKPHVAKFDKKLQLLFDLSAEKAEHESTTKVGSGKSFGEVGSGFSKLKDVNHDLSVIETGTGIYEGNQCSVKTPGAISTDCTNIVLEVLGNTFNQQGRSADWERVKRKYRQNITARGSTELSGLDVQAALQSEVGWKGIYWAPDPKYLVPKEELSHANSDEASFTSGRAKDKGTYYKDYGKKGYPGLSISQSVTNYAPEQPKAGHGTASTLAKDTTQLEKLKKLPFGILAAHGGHHMTIITYGKIIEVHWDKEATDVNVIEQTDLAQWAIGSNSGYHYFASGAIVAPANDVDNAFK
jgi:hypothetical protein